MKKSNNFSLLVFVVGILLAVSVAPTYGQPKKPVLRIVDPADIGRAIDKGSAEDNQALQQIEAYKSAAKVTDSQKQAVTDGLASAVIISEPPSQIFDYVVNTLMLTTATVREPVTMLVFETRPNGSVIKYSAWQFDNGFGQGLGFILHHGGFSTFESAGNLSYDVYFITAKRVERVATTIPVFIDAEQQWPQLKSVTEQALGRDTYLVVLNGRFFPGEKPTIVIGCCQVVDPQWIVSVTANQIRVVVRGVDTYLRNGDNLYTLSLKLVFPVARMETTKGCSSDCIARGCGRFSTRERPLFLFAKTFYSCYNVSTYKSY